MYNKRYSEGTNEKCLKQGIKDEPIETNESMKESKWKRNTGETANLEKFCQINYFIE